MRIVVTGGSGRAGEYILAECASRGHDVVNADLRPPPEGAQYSGGLFQRVDCEDMSALITATRGADAIIHMAAIPAPNTEPERVLFRINMMSNWNVLEACEINGIQRVVMASSINAVGAGWGDGLIPTEYFPVDEEHPTRVQDAYSQSKWLGEQMADAFIRRGHIKQIASMRFHGLWDLMMAKNHRVNGDKIATGGRNAMGFWSWVGRHDAARACRLAIEKDLDGHQVFFINASDTVLEISTEEALGKEYPGIPVRKPLGQFESPLSIEKAKRLLGWIPLESWREGLMLAAEPPPDARREDYQAPWTRIRTRQ